MARPTWGWTDRHTAVAVMVTTASAASLAGLTEAVPVPLAVAAAVAVTAAVSLLLDGFGGAVVGIACAAGLVAVRRATGHWQDPDFWAALVETLAIVATGVAGGIAGSRLRNGSAAPALRPFEPVYGSLGLFGQDEAMARLEEEVDRAREHRRPLSLVLLDVTVKNPDLSEAGGAAAMRAAARIVENRVGDRDVPFALATDRLGVVLPEANRTRAYETVAEILGAIDSARFTFGPEREQRHLADDINLHVGLAQYGPSLSSTEALLDAAIAALVEPADDEARP